MTSQRSVLVLSQRKVARTPANSVLYEFEDLISDWEYADIVELGSYHGDSMFDFRRSAFQGLRLFGASAEKTLKFVSPKQGVDLLQRRYDLVILVTSTAFDLFTLSQVSSLRDRADQIVVYVAETWPKGVDRRKLRLEPWELVDKVFVGLPSAAQALSHDLQREVVSVPIGVDTFAFDPGVGAQRPIDVVNPGRRGDKQHAQLWEVCDEDGLWYWFDTLRGEMVGEASQHRARYAGLMKRSHTAICNAARFDDPQRIGHTKAVPYRVIESMAAGCRIIGQKIPSSAFLDVGLPVMPFPELRLEPTAAEVRQLLAADWSESDSANYVTLARKNLDWSHRWAAILGELGLEPTPALTARRDELRSELTPNTI